MNKNIDILPHERKINYIQLLLRWQTAAFLFCMIFVGVGTYLTYIGVLASGDEKLITMICGGIVILFGLLMGFVILKIMNEYVVTVKKGERLFVEIISVSKNSFWIKGKTENIEINTHIEVPKVLILKYKKYTLVPAFYYNENVFIDWNNIESFGSLKIDTPEEMYEQTPQDTKIAIQAQKESQNIITSDFERVYTSRILSSIISYLVAAFVLIAFSLKYTIQYINILLVSPAFDLMYAAYCLITLTGVNSAFLAIISVATLLKYKNAKKHGDKVISKVTFYYSISSYKKKKSKLFTDPIALVGKGSIMDLEYTAKYESFSYKGICSFSSVFYDELKNETALPAIFYKGKVYPDWNGIAKYIEIKNAQNNQVE